MLKCHWCKKRPGNTRDHVIPIAFYRRKILPYPEVMRIVPCCQTCNNARSGVTTRILELRDLFFKECVNSTYRVIEAERKLIAGLGVNFVEWSY